MSIQFNLWQLLPKHLSSQLNESDKEKTQPDVYLHLINPYLPKNIYIKYLDNDSNLDEVYRFLLEHYTNNDIIRIYSKNLLSYYFQTNPMAIIHVLKLQETNEIIGCISTVLKPVYYNGKKLNIHFVNFLCIHKNYRSSLLALYLILEQTKYIMTFEPNFIYIFNSHKNIENSFSTINYYTRPINIAKLIKHNYFELPKTEDNENNNDYTFLNKLENYFKIDKNNIFQPLKKINYNQDNHDSQNNINLIKTILERLNTFNSTKKLSSIVSEKELTNILENKDFICLTIDNFNIYVDLYIIKEIKNNVTNVAVINNFYYPQFWNHRNKIKLINSIVYFLYNSGIDEIIISDQFANLDFEKLKGYKIAFSSRTFTNYPIDSILSCENSILNF